MKPLGINISVRGGDIIFKKANFVSFILVFALVFFILKYAGWTVVALLLLILTVSAVDSAAEKISALIRLPKRLCAVGIIILALILSGTVGVIGVSALVSQCRELLLSFANGRGSALLLIDTLLCRIEELSSFTDGKNFGYLSDAVHSLVNKGTAYLLSALGRWTASFIGKAPQMIGGAVFFTICAIWLSVDLDGIRREARRVLPTDICDRLFFTIGKIRQVSTDLALSYTVLFALTFAETYIGLCLLRIPFPLALAFLVAAVDILPLLGASALLLPLAAIATLSGSWGVGIGIFALLGVLYVTRRIAEPCVVGKRIGVHPFISFVSAFTGLILFGPSGAIALPLLAALTVK